MRGKTIALVYIFENENAAGFEHFLTWKNEIISGWLNAIYELDCLPYIIDVRTFLQKASNYSLPHIDYVINLNNGCYELSTMGLVPSICSFLKIPCIPCDAVAILTTENKRISNYIARGIGITIPDFLNKENNNGIYRPINLGNSIGIKQGKFKEFTQDGVYQEFIPGYDITIPVAYNFCSHTLDVLPAILYLPDSLDPNWIFNEEIKAKDTGFVTLPFLDIEKKAKTELINLCKAFNINAFGRIDARIKCKDHTLSKNIVQYPLSLNNLYFIEINSMPTIESGDGFDLAFDAITQNSNHSFYDCVMTYRNSVKNPTMNGFLLACSISATLTSKC